MERDGDGSRVAVSVAHRASDVVNPKSDEQRKRLNDAIKHILLFRSLDQEQMQEVLDAMFEKAFLLKLIKQHLSVSPEAHKTTSFSFS
ncbi:hypothetical protein RRG08_067063 [Elysia crispata]|uniref:Uncharacterized protein n=1 Tax=Elysia crispata TaxID=231223 RepID=A0AAE1B7Z0_9GAST|nr:hypothetical protein RRG08_067063 [Elysia crispata]